MIKKNYEKKYNRGSITNTNFGNGTMIIGTMTNKNLD